MSCRFSLLLALFLVVCVDRLNPPLKPFSRFIGLCFFLCSHGVRTMTACSRRLAFACQCKPVVWCNAVTRCFGLRTRAALTLDECALHSGQASEQRRCPLPPFPVVPRGVTDSSDVSGIRQHNGEGEGAAAGCRTAAPLLTLANSTFERSKWSVLTGKTARLRNRQRHGDPGPTHRDHHKHATTCLN